MTMLLALLGLLAAAGAPDVTVIVGATLVDGGGRAPMADSVVIVRGGVLAAVGDRAHTPIPKGASIVDGRRAWIAPAPAALPSADGLGRAIYELARGPVSRLQAGQPAHIALLDGDPRDDRLRPAVRRIWIAGKPRESAEKAAR